jgi:hypothetical protein
MQRFTHVALTLPAAQLEGAPLDELLGFYADVFGWSEDRAFAIPGKRVLIRAPSLAQYITLRAADAAMTTSGYEHLGVALESEPELVALHARAAAWQPRFAELTLSPIESAYGGRLRSFRLHFRLPLTLELQYLGDAARE